MNLNKYILFTFLTFVFAIFSSGTILSQTFPELINYQAVARDSGGEILANQNIGVKFVIRQGTPDGTNVWEEVHNTGTNEHGLFDLKIGSETPLNTIDWSAGTYFLNVQIDPDGGSSYINMGTSQLISVPYAMHSKTSEDSFSGDYLDLSNKPVIPENVSDLNNDEGFLTEEKDSSVTNEIQSLNLSNDTLYLSNGGFIVLPEHGIQITGNEGQIIYHDGNDWVSTSDLTIKNGNIGLSESDPSSKLEVNGDVTIPADNEYTYSEAKTYYYNISVNTLQSIRPDLYDYITDNYVSGEDKDGGYGYFINGTAGEDAIAVAPIHLPDGAVLKSAKVHYFDNDGSNNITVAVIESGPLSVNSDEINSYTSSEDNVDEFGQVTGSFDLNDTVINNENNTYYFKFKSKRSNTSMGIRDIIITYTVSKAN